MTKEEIRVSVIECLNSQFPEVILKKKGNWEYVVISELPYDLESKMDLEFGARTCPVINGEACLGIHDLYELLKNK